MQPMKYHNNLSYQFGGPTTADDLREKTHAFSVLFGEHELQVRGEFQIKALAGPSWGGIDPYRWWAVSSFSSTHLVIFDPRAERPEPHSVLLEEALEYRIQPDF